MTKQNEGRLLSVEQEKFMWDLIKKEVVTFQDACKYLNVSADYLNQLASNNEILHYLPDGKTMYFMKSEIDQWLISNKKALLIRLDNDEVNSLLKNSEFFNEQNLNDPQSFSFYPPTEGEL